MSKTISICTLHGMAAARLAKLGNTADASMGHDAKCLVRECADIVEEASERGRAMEERLREYREAIEALGFKRGQAK